MRIHFIRMSWIMIVACLIAGACRKIVQPAVPADSQLAFFNVSQYLFIQMLQGGGTSYVLLDNNTAPYTYPDTPGGNPPPLPLFSFGSDEYPANVGNVNTSQPWETYMHVHPGPHSLVLTDTGGHYSLLSRQSMTNSTCPTTVFFADSLGVFGCWITQDTLTVVPGQARIRLVDLSPDAGSLFFQVGNQAPPPGSPDSVRYGLVTSFIDFPGIAADTTLQFSFYNPGDTVDVITAAQVQVSPGHSYTLLIEGYENAQSFADPVTGNNLTFPPDLKIQINQNN